jgi:hypothetical protein
VGQKSKQAEEVAGPAAQERGKKEQEKEKSNEVPLSGRGLRKREG